MLLYELKTGKRTRVAADKLEPAGDIFEFSYSSHVLADMRPSERREHFGIHISDDADYIFISVPLGTLIMPTGVTAAQHYRMRRP